MRWILLRAFPVRFIFLSYFLTLPTHYLTSVESQMGIQHAMRLLRCLAGTRSDFLVKRVAFT